MGSRSDKKYETNFDFLGNFRLKESYVTSSCRSFPNERSKGGILGNFVSHLDVGDPRGKAHVFFFCELVPYMDVSKNSGTPKSSILICLSMKKTSILGYSYFWKHLYDMISQKCHENCQELKILFSRQIPIPVIYLPASCPSAATHVL